jgi:hypothetical protein
MRLVTSTFAAALLAAACQFPIAAHAQTAPAQSSQADTPQEQSPATTDPTPVPADPTPAPADPAAIIPEQKLDAAAAAMQRVAILKRDYFQLLQATPADDQPRVVNEASNAIEKAVSDQGLSVEEYTSILEQAKKDPQVREKIIERIQAPER